VYPYRKYKCSLVVLELGYSFELLRVKSRMYTLAHTTSDWDGKSHCSINKSGLTVYNVTTLMQTNMLLC